MISLDLAQFKWDQFPWYVSAFFLLVIIVLSFVAKRFKSRDTTQSKFIEQAVNRQNALDLRQEQMMDDLQEEIDRVREEMTMLRKELNTERTRNLALEVEMRGLREANELLSKENARLTALVDALRSELDHVKAGQQVQTEGQQAKAE